jgi:tetratricopeptide (TPR) repeat protein
MCFPPALPLTSPLALTPAGHENTSGAIGPLFSARLTATFPAIRCFNFSMTLRLAALMLVAAAFARADSGFDSAVTLFNEKKFPEARVAFEKIIDREPGNAAACHYLGEILLRRGDASAIDDAVPWLEKAARLEPTNASYLADYGGASMQLAAIHTSLGAATRGRDAMEQAIKLDPNDLEARTGLMQFYDRAPWPIGSSERAAAQLEEIRKRDPDLATVLSVIGKANGGDYAAAFRLCDDVLARQPNNYTALYQYGRTASISGRNLDRGLACLKQCLTLPVPGPAAPSYSNTWHRIGVIQDKLGHPADARTAYAVALKLDPNNRQASDALAKLK